MLLDLEELISAYNLQITGIIHCGAHLAEEAPLYHRLGLRNVWWIEGNPGVMPKLEAFLFPFSHKLIGALLTDEDHGQRMFHVTNYDGMSSSIFQFGQIHLDSSPDTQFVEHVELETRTLDSLVKEHGIEGCNMLNCDLQGAELLVFKGARKLLNSIDYIYCEVNTDYVYQDCCLVDELDEYLGDFTRVETGMTPASWGDSLYIRSSLMT